MKILIAIYCVTAMTSFASGQVTEHHSGYAHLMRDCKGGNLYKCDVTRQRLCKFHLGDNRWGSEHVCRHGVYSEDFSECSNFERAYDFCSTGYERIAILRECGGKCDRNTESIKYKCKSNPACAKIQHRHCRCEGVLGEWSEWGPYGACSAKCGGGIKERARYKCYDKITNEAITDCGPEKIWEKGFAHCNTFPCKWVTPTTTEKISVSPTTASSKKGVVEKKIPLSVNCDFICAISIGSSSNFIQNCEIESKCESIQDTVVVSCDGRTSCAKENVVCSKYREWTPWTRWNESEGKRQRTRYRPCVQAENLPKYKSCHQGVMTQTQCEETAEKSKSTERISTTANYSGTPWLLPLIVVLGILILLFCCCCTWCCCMKRKRRKRKEEHTTQQQMSNGTNGHVDDVFIHSTGRSETPYVAAGPSGGLRVLDRIERISEHIYEAISMRGSRLFPKSSTADDGAAQPDRQKMKSPKLNGQLYVPAVENEYVSDEEASSRTPSPFLLPGPPIGTTSRPQEANQKENVQRVSVLVTDPEGREVEPDETPDEKPTSSLLGAPPRNTPEYVAMNTDRNSVNYQKQAMLPSATQRKRQWDRVPSPPSATSPKPGFFKAKENEDGDNKQEKEARPVGVFKVGIMNMLQHVRASPAERQPLHKYDEVPQDTPMTDTFPDGPIYIPSAPPSVCDNVSLWSDSSFDSTNLSDRESLHSGEDDQNAQDIKKAFRSNLKSGRKGKGKSKAGNSKLSSDLLNAPSTSALPVSGYLTPNNKRLPSVQYLTPRPGNPLNAKGQGQISSTPSLFPLSTEHNKEGATYLNMNKDRSTVKSWLNLGPAPEPQVSHTNTNSNDSLKSYCSANDLSQRQLKEMKRAQREQSLDEKYTTSPVRDQIHAKPETSGSDLPTDHDGYFNVGFPGSPTKRINTIAAQNAVKQMIRAPLMPKK